MRGWKNKEFVRMDDDGLPSIVQELHKMPGLMVRVVYFDDTAYQMEDPGCHPSQRDNPVWWYLEAERDAIRAYHYLVSQGETVGQHGKQLFLI